MMSFIYIFNNAMNDIYNKKDIIIIKDDNKQYKFKPNHYKSQRDFIRHFDRESKNNPFVKQFDRPENSQLGDLNVRKYFDIHTRGEPNDFHIIGTLSRNNIPFIDNNNQENQPNNNDNNADDKNNNHENPSGHVNTFIDDNRILNLYGRAKYTNGNSPYEYYTRITSGNEMIKIDLGERRELMDGEDINIPELNSTYKLKKYPNDMFRYNPFDY